MSTPAPELKEWDNIRTYPAGHTRVTSIDFRRDDGYAHFCLYSDGVLDMRFDPDRKPRIHQLRALIDEAERVGRRFWGEEWGRGEGR